MKTIKEWNVKPAAPDDNEAREFYRGTVLGQIARQKKGTALVQLWWWGDGGHWGQLAPLDEGHFIIKPTLARSAHGGDKGE